MHICPVCDARAIPYLQKVATALDTLIPAQCRKCGKYCVVPSSSLSRLGYPDMVVAPIGIIVWCFTQDLRLAAQLGLLGSVVVFGLVARYAPLVAFVPENEKSLNSRRKRMSWGNLFLLVVLLALTLLIPHGPTHNLATTLNLLFRAQ